jgi:hypothetical protein
VSLRDSHNETLRLRERELNVGRSQLFQMFLDIEARSNILRREMLQRLRRPGTNSNLKRKETSDRNQVPNLAVKQNA